MSIDVSSHVEALSRPRLALNADLSEFKIRLCIQCTPCPSYLLDLEIVTVSEAHQDSYKVAASVGAGASAFVC